MVCSVIALGFFDGVHLGHGALLRRTAELAAEKGCRALALTFDRSPGKDGRLLSSVEDRTRLIRGLYGIDEVVVLPFTDELRHMAWETFLENLVRDHGALHLVCGWDYRFGYMGAGDPDKLRAWCALRGLGCDVVDKLVVDGITVSSTILKDMVEAGDVEAACRYYGHPHVLTGTVLPGQHLGSRLGFPTANLEPAPELVLPRDGVYAVTGTAGGRTCTGVCNVGTRPTVGGGRRTVETWLDDFDGNLYGRELTVSFHRFLREERRFPDLEALRAQVRLDRTAMLNYFDATKRSEKETD